MVSAKRLTQMAKKWQRIAALGRKRLWTSSTIRSSNKADQHCTLAPVKGHCIVYTTDGRRFEVPLEYLGTVIIGELLRMSQEEFGFASHGRIMLPCDAVVMEYIMCLLGRHASEEVERAFLSSSMVRPYHLEPSSMGPSRQQVASF